MGANVCQLYVQNANALLNRWNAGRKINVLKKHGLSYIARLSAAILTLTFFQPPLSSYGMAHPSSSPTMMLLTLHREESSKYRTFGLLTYDGKAIYTLEETEYLIPKGRYKIEMTYSPHFKRYLPLLIVPHRSAIRLHEGTWPRDSSGCILVGLTRGQNMLLQSRAALDPLVTQIQQALASHEPVWIEIS